MDEYKNKLKIACIISFIVGSCLIFANLNVRGVINIVFAVILLRYSYLDFDECLNKKTSLIIMAIVATITNVVAMIFIVLAIDSLNYYKSRRSNAPPQKKKNEKQKKIVDPETKKINMLLQLGVFLVLISGILFATTSWNNMTIIIKGLGLILFATLFLGLSYFTELKLKLKTTSFVYCLLSVSFYLFTWISACYFKLFGNELALEGQSMKLVLSISCLIIVALVFYMLKRFKENRMLYIIYSAILLGLGLLMSYFKFEIASITIVLTIILLVTNMISKDKTELNIFSKFVSYIIWILVFIRMKESNKTLFLIASLTNILNIQALFFKDKKTDSLMTIVLTYFLLLFSFLQLDSNIVNNVIMMIIITIYTEVVNRFSRYSEEFKKFNYAAYTIGTLVIFISGFSNEFSILFISSLYLIMSLVEYFAFENRNKTIASIQPIAIGIFFYAIFNVTNIHLSKVYIQDYFTLLTVVYILFQVFIQKKDKELSNEYYYFGIASFIIASLINMTKVNLVMCLFEIFISIFLIVLYKKENKTKYITSYCLLLFNILSTFSIINVLSLGSFTNNLIVIFSYVIIYLINVKENLIKKITNFAILVPLYLLISSSGLTYEIEKVANNVFFFYILYLLLKYLVDDNSKEIFMIIMPTLILLNIFFEVGIIFGVYIGILGFIFIVLGYSNKKYNKVFYYGIVLTILNILYRLKDLWGAIPFWAYLLIIGLLLIGFVTYKETKKINNKDKK